VIWIVRSKGGQASEMGGGGLAPLAPSLRRPCFIVLFFVFFANFRYFFRWTPPGNFSADALVYKHENSRLPINFENYFTLVIFTLEKNFTFGRFLICERVFFESETFENITHVGSNRKKQTYNSS